MTMEQVLRTIKQERGMSALRSQEQLVGLFKDFSKNQLRPQANALKVFLDCQGNTRILNLQNATAQERQVQFHRLVREMAAEHNMQEETAVEVCSTFWRVALETAPPAYTQQKSSLISVPPPAPAPVKTAEDLYQEGLGCQDAAQKVQLFQQAANLGHLDAMLHLGFAYEYGNGISKNAYEAAKWFRKAAEQGNAGAQDRMAYYYDKGFGVERDLDKAIEWCQRANNQNFPDAARHLRQLEEKKHQETPDISGNKPEFEILNGALLKYNGSAEKVTVPGGVTRVGAKAFFGNDAIRSVTLPYGLIGLGAEAFAGCKNLQQVTIPGSVIAVNLDVFAGCRKLKKIILQSGVQKLSFGDHLDQLGSVSIVIPDSVSSVTWSHMSESQRTERMKHPKGILASKGWTDRLQDFFSKNPDFRSGKIRRMGFKQLALGALAALLVFSMISIITDSEGKRTRSDFAPFQLEDSIEDMLLAGTEEIYTYPDGTWMEFYYDDAGQEIYRVYVNQEDDIENLFEARYDAAGRLVYHQIFDGQGNLLRADSYDFHSSEDTAQRRITLGNGQTLQGVSTFDENGYETFTLNHQDGTKTVYVYKDGGVLTNQTEYDAEGEETVSQAAAYGPDWENAPKVYGPRQTVVGWTNGNTYTTSYVQGICGGALKEYSVNDVASEEDQAAFMDIYDPMGNLLEMRHYEDTQMQKLWSHEIHSYDQQGNYTGYTDTYYYGDGDYYIDQYDANGIQLTHELHRFEGEEETVLSTRYETEVDDQGREILIREYDGTTGRLKAIEENEYDAEGNVKKETRTAYYDDGRYNISVRNGDWKTLSSITYYPSGNVSEIQEYTAEGVMTKRTWYYENGQIKELTEYNDAQAFSKSTEYYESGALKAVDEYSDAGVRSKSTDYYENGELESVNEYNDFGDIIKSINYDEDGSVRYSFEYRYEYDANGNMIKQINLDDQGAVIGWETVEYDADGNKAKTTNYDASGKLEYWTEYTYDDEGYFVDSQTHYPD